ncbi:MAG: hypothetical protein ACYDDO_02595 [Acidiferrobacterales bacterium]
MFGSKTDATNAARTETPEDSAPTSPESGSSGVVVTEVARRFAVLSVEEAEAPDGTPGKHWYRYVIEVPGSNITGMRCGSKQEVTRFAHDYVENLSQRNSLRAGYMNAAKHKK